MKSRSNFSRCSSRAKSHAVPRRAGDRRSRRRCRRPGRRGRALRSPRPCRRRRTSALLVAHAARSRQEVLDGGVAWRGDADATPGLERGDDHPRPAERLAGSGRPLDGQDRAGRDRASRRRARRCPPRAGRTPAVAARDAETTRPPGSVHRRRARLGRARSAPRAGRGTDDRCPSTSAAGAGGGLVAAAAQDDVVLVDCSDGVALVGRRVLCVPGSSRNSCGGNVKRVVERPLVRHVGGSYRRTETRRSRRGRRAGRPAVIPRRSK